MLSACPKMFSTAVLVEQVLMWKRYLWPVTIIKQQGEFRIKNNEAAEHSPEKPLSILDTEREVLLKGDTPHTCLFLCNFTSLLNLNSFPQSHHLCGSFSALSCTIPPSWALDDSHIWSQCDYSVSLQKVTVICCFIKLNPFSLQPINTSAATRHMGACGWQQWFVHLPLNFLQGCSFKKAVCFAVKRCRKGRNEATEQNVTAKPTKYYMLHPNKPPIDIKNRFTHQVTKNSPPFSWWCHEEFKQWERRKHTSAPTRNAWASSWQFETPRMTPSYSTDFKNKW